MDTGVELDARIGVVSERGTDSCNDALGRWLCTMLPPIPPVEFGVVVTDTRGWGASTWGPCGDRDGGR